MYGHCLRPAVLLLPLGLYMMRINILCTLILQLIVVMVIVLTGNDAVSCETVVLYRSHHFRWILLKLR